MLSMLGRLRRLEVVDRRVADIARRDFAVLLGVAPLSETLLSGEGSDDSASGDALGADLVAQRAVEQLQQDEESQHEEERGEERRGHDQFALVRLGVDREYRRIDDLERRRGHLPGSSAAGGPC